MPPWRTGCDLSDAPGNSSEPLRHGRPDWCPEPASPERPRWRGRTAAGAEGHRSHPPEERHHYRWFRPSSCHHGGPGVIFQMLLETLQNRFDTEGQTGVRSRLLRNGLAGGAVQQQVLKGIDPIRQRSATTTGGFALPHATMEDRV